MQRQPTRDHPPITRTHAARLGIVLLALESAPALAFPLIDPANQDQVPTETGTTAPDAQDLQHQLRMVDGLSAPAGGGWTFLPRLDLQGMLTDNVMQVNAPRQWDLATFVSPGIGIAGDEPRLQLTLDYAPTLALYAHAGSLNALTQQLTGIGLVTVVPDWAYVDVRALAGVHSLYGGIGGLGTVGASASATNASAAAVASLAGNSVGLNKSNEVQTDSFSLSPYLLRRFGDYGTGKLGYSLDVAQSSLLTGFASSPLPSGGNSESQVTNEEIAHFTTDEFLSAFQDVFDVDLQQSQSSSGAAFTAETGGLPTATNTVESTREIVTDQVRYAINHTVTVFVSGGHENIAYPGVIEPIDDLTWSVGTTLTPNADSLLTVSYGHLNGFNAFSATGHYDVTARTVLDVSYGTTLGTQLQNLQGQLNQATVNGNGSLVNAQTGGVLFSNTNALGVQNGVFRTDTLTVGGRTTLDRDILAVNVFITKQTPVGTVASTEATSNTVDLQWTHELRPDLTLSSAAAYSQQDQGSSTVLNPGHSWSVAASVALRYQISDTLSTSLRYAFFDRQSADTTFSAYQSLLIFGVTKTF